ncbi:MAG: TatD family hydrolase [Patescibacteria group bacterium]
MKYFDAHCHLDSKQIAPTREKILHTMKQEAIAACTVGVDSESSRRALAIARSCENIWACIGQHPVDNPKEEFKPSIYQKLIDEHTDEVVCIGECGLDYYWLSKKLANNEITQEDFEADKVRQRILFHKQITLALVNDLPLMLHLRSSEGTEDAHREALEILDSHKDSQSLQAIFHFYTASTELAQEITKRGHYISLPGVITFSNARLDEMVQSIPLKYILAETDTPYAAPVPHRGKTNSPLYVEYVYKKIAEIHNLDEEEVRVQILKNTERVFGITLTT